MHYEHIFFVNMIVVKENSSVNIFKVHTIQKGFPSPVVLVFQVLLRRKRCQYVQRGKMPQNI